MNLKFLDKTFISNLTNVYKESILIKNAQVYFVRT